MKSIKRYKVKLIIEKSEPCIYLSQLDLQRFYTRALRRSKLPIYYTQGFNPHPKMSYLNTLKVGTTGILEILLQFTELIDIKEVTQSLSLQFVDGLKIISAEHAGTVG